jgi:hypothetical protein
MLGKPTNYAVMIESAETASMLVDELHLLPANKKNMYLALQGVNLGRHGRVCLGLLTIPSTPSGAPSELARVGVGAGKGWLPPAR